jgi:hypothetical protein
MNLAVPGDLLRTRNVADQEIGGTEKVEALGAIWISFNQALQLDDGVVGRRGGEVIVA